MRRRRGSLHQGHVSEGILQGLRTGLQPARLALCQQAAGGRLAVQPVHHRRNDDRDPLGRAAFARPLEPPYRASWVTGALAHTQGGLVTDGEGRVLDARSRPLPGLWAAGGAAAGLAGRGGSGYLPGNGLAQAFGLAWRAAASAVGAR